MMVSSGHEDVILDEVMAFMKKATSSRASTTRRTNPRPKKSLLVGFLLVWLKKCVVLSPPPDGILSWMLFPDVQLTHGKPLGLLSGMVCCIQ